MKLKWRAARRFSLTGKSLPPFWKSDYCVREVFNVVFSRAPHDLKHEFPW